MTTKTTLKSSDMNNRSKLFLTLGLLWMSTGLVHAQKNVKMGYINWQSIVARMPEMKVVNLQLRKLVQAKQEDAKGLMKTFQVKQQKYTKEAPKQTQAINAQRSRELQKLEQEIQQEEQKATKDIDKTRERLMQPLLDKVQNAIDFVAKKYGYDVILRSEAVLYFKKQSDNIASKVMKKLGIELPKKQK